MVWIIKFSILILYFFKLNSISGQNSFSISFGSCLHQNKDMSILDTIHKNKPDLLIFMGDIIYKDTHNPNEKKMEYDKLKNLKVFQDLSNSTKIIATWDDHDYGINDSGKEYPEKKESQNLFLDFLNEPIDSKRRQREGIYSSNNIFFNKLNIHIILLDTRYFRTGLKKKYIFWGDYIPNDDKNASILGEEQWIWLEEELKKSSDLKIIVSSIQFFNEDHPFEKWGNFPNEKKKFLNLIKNKNISNLILLSGDRHISESFQFYESDFGNIIELTASPFNIEIPFSINEVFNKNRISSIITKSNFGNILIEDKNNEYRFLFQYILKNNEKIVIPINYSIPKKL